MAVKKAPNMHLDMSLLAKSLKLASIDVIKASQIDIESQWYQSSGPVDLFFWDRRMCEEEACKASNEYLWANHRCGMNLMV